MLLVLGGAGYFDNRKVAEVVPATTTEIVAAPVAAPAEVAPATAPAQ
jgi:hypothetical protein